MAVKAAENILELIGNTPLIKLGKSSSENSALIYAKFEALNPGGSVKDRVALAMVEDAERRGVLKAGGTVVEPTSGNTGIGLALVCAVRGYRCVLVMPEDMSVGKRGIAQAFGAELVLTPAKLSMKGAVDKAEELVSQNPGWFMPMQFANKSNPAMHRKTTAKEILKALDGKVHAFVAGVGTGGSLSGIGEVLKKRNPKVQVIAVEPKESAVLSGSKPGSHHLQGIGAGFVPAILNRSIIDEVMAVSDQDALEAAKQLARQEGILVGLSAGANVFAAQKIARRLGKGKIVVTLLSDMGERYLDAQGAYEL